MWINCQHLKIGKYHMEIQSVTSLGEKQTGYGKTQPALLACTAVHQLD